MKEPVPVWKNALRKANTIRSVSSPADRLNQSQYVERITRIQGAAADSGDPFFTTRSFWQMEKVSAEFFKNPPQGGTLADSRIPLAARPIVHCGMGIGAVEAVGFELARLQPRVEGFTSPDYRPFCTESLGAMLGVYAPGPFFAIASGMRRIGLLPMANLTRPEPASYLEHFDLVGRRLLSHGFGRILFFRNLSVSAAIRIARNEPHFDRGSCVRGIAFAMAMVNCADVRRVISDRFEWGADWIDHAFDQGLVYALVFWEWMSPGFLERFPGHGELARRRRLAARREIEAALDRGHPAVFDLEFELDF